jgi:ABC-2 type transport system ATP-binding protein
VTVLVSTHLLDEVEQVCTDVLILNRGRVAALGPVADVVARAAAPRSARLRTDPDRLEDAARVLAAVDAVRTARFAGGRPGAIAIELSPAVDPQDAVAAALAALLEAGVPVAEFSLDGGRLSDAFLEVVSA